MSVTIPFMPSNMIVPPQLRGVHVEGDVFEITLRPAGTLADIGEGERGFRVLLLLHLAEQRRFLGAGDEDGIAGGQGGSQFTRTCGQT